VPQAAPAPGAAQLQLPGRAPSQPFQPPAAAAQPFQAAAGVADQAMQQPQPGMPADLAYGNGAAAIAPNVPAMPPIPDGGSGPAAGDASKAPAAGPDAGTTPSPTIVSCDNHALHSSPLTMIIVSAEPAAPKSVPGKVWHGIVKHADQQTPIHLLQAPTPAQVISVLSRNHCVVTRASGSDLIVHTCVYAAPPMNFSRHYAVACTPTFLTRSSDTLQLPWHHQQILTVIVLLAAFLAAFLFSLIENTVNCTKENGCISCSIESA
jgi:hypothetical protein